MTATEKPELALVVIGTSPDGAFSAAVDELLAVAQTLRALEAGNLNLPELAARRMRELDELRDLVMHAGGEHEHRLASRCSACLAEKRIRELSRGMRGVT